MRMSNVEIAATLGLSQSTVSRMRAGHRLASLGVLQAISDQYDVDSSVLLAAASRAEPLAPADRIEWITLLDQIFDDGEEDPDAPLESELAPAFISPGDG